MVILNTLLGLTLVAIFAVFAVLGQRGMCK